MSDADLEHELRLAFEELPDPDDAGARIDSVVGRAMAFRARRRRRRTAIAAVALAVAIAGSAFAYSQLFREDGRTVPRGPGDAPARRAQVPQLAGLPWLWQPAGARRVDEAPAGTPALRFSAGVGYRDAARALYTSVAVEGTLPEGARVVAALPAGVVADTSDGVVTISLAAPFGYDPETGQVVIPRLVLPGSMSPRTVRSVIQAVQKGRTLESLPGGIQVEWPGPASCQTSTDGTLNSPKCPYSLPGNRHTP